MKKVIFGLLLLTCVSCKVTEGDPPPGTALAGSIDLVFRDPTTMYVANANLTIQPFSTGSLTVVDTSNPTNLLATNGIVTDLFNSRMALDQVAVPNRLFVANRLSQNDQDFSDPVYVYDTTDPGNPAYLQSMQVADDPYGIAIVPAGPEVGWVLVSHLSLGVIRYFDGNNLDAPIGFINLASQFWDGSRSSAVAVSPDGSRAVVTNIAQNLLYILDLTPPDEFTLEAVLVMTFQGFYVNDFRDAVWLDSNRFAVTNRNVDHLFILDLGTIVAGAPLPDDTTIEELNVDIPGNSATFAIPMSPFSDPTPVTATATHIYVGEFNTSLVTSINLATLVVEDKTSSGNIGFGPVALRVSPDEQFLYVANQITSTLGIIDTTTGELVGHFP